MQEILRPREGILSDIEKAIRYHMDELAKLKAAQESLSEDSINGHTSKGSPTEFAGFGARKAGHTRGAGEALQYLLETRHIPSIRLGEAVETLQKGGYRYAPKSPKRQLSLGAHSNPKLFYDKANQMIWLRKEWEKTRN